MRSIKSLKRFFYPEISINKFASLNYKPNLFTVIRNSPYLLYKRRYAKQYFLNYKAARVKNKNEKMDLESLPEIEILVCSIKKDFILLKTVIEKSINNSLNPIRKVSIIVPHDDLLECKKIFLNFNQNITIEIACEDTIISERIRNKIKNFNLRRYGWILQQLITIQFALKADIAGVLQINSDTILLNKMAWLDKNGIQILMPTPYYHEPYYQLLNKLNPDIPLKGKTYISHHMLFQPNIWKLIFNELKLNTLEDLIDFALNNSSRLEESPFCLEYELYAQMFKLIRPDLIEEIRFANFTYSRSNEYEVESFKSWLELNKSNYNSVSVHSYT
jgi:hypothetical protein